MAVSSHHSEAIGTALRDGTVKYGYSERTPARIQYQYDILFISPLDITTLDELAPPRPFLSRCRL
jgi:hypothetical protein